ncbi:MAG: asparagine--tRNA ligase [Acholeplasmatales bacterium]|jgi:asparaginyl-tRNA synthetase|nr:asparagine--tRNA ligase [Acholeplasmatales bacterium]
MKITNKELQTKYVKLENKQVVLSGWVRTNRDQKSFGFLTINDGSTLDNVQVVYAEEDSDFETLRHIRVGAAVVVEGNVVVTPLNAQKYELRATNVAIAGDSPENYPIQPKRHTREFLREVAHLRVRTNLFNAVFRVRSKVAYAIHKFFQEQNFVYVHTPIITSNDGEGAGQMFNVTTFDLDKIPYNDSKEVDYSKDFFGKRTNLAVTGQLEAESYALAFSNVYTFGPTFRAENSNTLTHASEFWMIEPEMAFCDLKGDMKIMENMLKYLVKYSLKELRPELEFFDKFVSPGLITKLEAILKKPFARITHYNAIKLIHEASKNGVKFENVPAYGEDIGKEHEKFLTEKHFNGPVFVTNWPKEIKAFYMKLNKDNRTVAAVDLLVPGSGELCGGSQREEDYDKLVVRMKELNMSEKGLEWYLDLRKYGGCVHSGFGMGFERLIMYLTGVENIRDVLPFPRTPKNAEF